MRTLAETLQLFLELPDMTQEKVATAMGVTQQAVQQVASGQTARPRYLPELLNFIEIHAPHLRVYEAYPEMMPAKKVLGERTGTILQFDHRTTEQNLETIDPPRDRAYSVKDLPVYASAEGGDGEVIVSHDPIDWVARPERLARIRGAYALYVINDSMIPALKPGYVIEVNPIKPPKSGNLVVVVLRDERDHATDERRCMVKEFVRKTADKVYLHQYNPERTFDIPLSEVAVIHLVNGIQFD